MISVILPTFKEPIEYISQAVESILKQTYKDIELIVIVDDPGREDIEKLLKKINDKRVKVIKNHQNIGLVASLNKAIDVASGDFVARMDADDISMRDRLEKQLNYLTKNNLDLVGSDIADIDKDGRIIREHVLYPRDDKRIKKMLRFNSAMPHPTWLGKMDVFRENKYNNFRACEDYDFLVRLAIKGKKLGNVGEILLKYRKNDDGISNKNKPLQRAGLSFISKKYRKGQITRSDDFETYLASDKGSKKLKSLDKFLSALRTKHFLQAINASAVENVYFTIRTRLIRRSVIKDEESLWFSKIRYFEKILEGVLKKNINNKKLNINYDNSVIFLLASDYNNTGDVLVRVSQENFLKNNIMEKEIVTVGYSETYRFLKDIQRNATKNTVIVLTGGGNIGDRYIGTEITRNYIIKLLEKNNCKIISFPQTVEFTSTKKGSFYLKKAKKVYGANKNLMLFMREGRSYDFARAVFDKAKIYLAPDIVLSHNTVIADGKREGVGLLLRDDSERILDKKFVNALLKRMNKKYKISKDDMVVKDFQRNKIYDYMNDKINFVSRKQLIITDRLHGMILCYITNTPCIVFPNANHKITETYENWLVGKQNFIVLEKRDEDIDKILKDMDALIKIKRVEKDPLSEDFGVLKDVLNKKNIKGRHHDAR